MGRAPECRIGSAAAEVLVMGGGGTVTAARRGAAFVQMSAGPVLAVLPHGSPIHPWAISVALDPSALREGTRIRIGGSVLALGTTIIPLRDTRVVDLRLLARPLDLPIGSMRHIITRQDRERDHEPAHAKALADYCSRGDLPGLVRIVGLGKGLTPSGDDALIGLLAAMDLLRDALEGATRERRRLVSTLLPELEEGTSIFSASMIGAAMRGQYAEPILGLMDELARGEATRASLHQACAALLEVGHDSGASILDGIRACFRRALSLDPGRVVIEPTQG